jgi:hypothetical protein
VEQSKERVRNELKIKEIGSSEIELGTYHIIFSMSYGFAIIIVATQT